MLLLGGVPEQRIFYSSDRNSGIPSGEDVGSYLRRSLQDAGLVIGLFATNLGVVGRCPGDTPG